MTSDKTPLLAIQNLEVTFGTGSTPFKAVSNLSLCIYPGEIVGLIGESGSGKTTCAHSILGLTEGYPGITQGKAQFEEIEILPEASEYIQQLSHGKIKKSSRYKKQHLKNLSPILGKKISSIFQEPKSALNPYFSIGNHLEECGIRGGLPLSEIKSAGLKTLAQVGIPEGQLVWDQYPHQLSGGMAQRVMIAMALLTHPKLIIADEPTTALDVTTQARLLQLFSNLRNQSQLSILLISHDIGVVREIADRVYVMYKGTLVESGSTKEVIQNPQHPYTKKLIGAFTKFASVGGVE